MQDPSEVSVSSSSIIGSEARSSSKLGHKEDYHYVGRGALRLRQGDPGTIPSS